MRLSAQEEYGLRCLTQLARAAPDSVTIGEVAAGEVLSEAYVAKLMRALREAGLVESIRGKKGGYKLARPADEISVGDVLGALGGHFYSQQFCQRYRGDGEACVHLGDCSLRALWTGVEHLVQAILRDCSLSQLLEGEGAMQAWIGARLGGELVATRREATEEMST